MEFLMDPSIWAGLLTLVILEIVLGIDNLVFIAILADKLPPKQRDKARLIGLSLALVMRLVLLSIISWMVTLTKPLFTVWDLTFSGRDLIMLIGGLFLLFKATTELHERLENREHDSGHGKGYASFWVVVAVLKSGVHATLAGVIVGFFIPLKEKHGRSPAKRLEHVLHPWVAYLILPLFAFANAGVSLQGVTLDGLTSILPLGIIAGLLIGKPLGISLFC